MKKLSYLIVLIVILGLVLTGCLLSNVGQVPTSDQSGVSGIAKDSIDPDLICFDFEDLAVGQDVTFPGIVWDYLKIYGSESDLTLEVIKVDPDTLIGEKVAYNTVTGTNNGCLEVSKGFGPVHPDKYTGPGGTHARPLDTNNIVFEFAQGVTVSTFSIDIFDYGDMVHKTGDYYSHFVVTLTAYDANGVFLDDYEYEITDGGQGITKYDACSSSGLGIHYLNVTGFGISKVEMAFTESIDVGIGFDNICFTPETNVCSTDLIAGQDFDDPVGDVKVEYTPGDEFITVTYNTNDPWLMEEIHFHASFFDPEDWSKPVVNKAGNPAPGQFLKVFEDLEELNTYLFKIPLSEIGVTGCGALYFAAHAKVYKLSNLIPRYIVSEASTSMVHVYLEEGSTGNPSISPISSNNSVEVSYDSWDNYFSTSGTGGSYESNGLGMSKWISDSEPWNTSVLWDASISSWREFLRSFLIPNNAVNLSGNLVITSDNAEEVKLNESPIWVCGVVYGPVPSSPSLGWEDVNDYNITSYLNTGNNDLTIWVRNWAQSGGSTNAANNPTGLIYRLNYKYQLKFEETAWGDGPSFPDAKNWSMYFKCLDLVPCPFTP